MEELNQNGMHAMESKKDRRGFASMDPEKRREIASLGGKAAHASGHAHEFTPDEAKLAGRKGGLKKHARLRGEDAEDNQTNS